MTTKCMANRINCEDAKAASAAFARVLSCRHRPSGWHHQAAGRPRSGFIELPKFKPESFAEKKMVALWLKILTKIDKKTHVASQELLDNPVVSQALEIVEESAYSEAEMAAYDQRIQEEIPMIRSTPLSHATAAAITIALDRLGFVLRFGFRSHYKQCGMEAQWNYSRC